LTRPQQRSAREAPATGRAKATPSELEWAGAPLPALIRLAWPIVVSMLSMSVMTLVDTLMVSTLGSWALAGVGLGGIVHFILICFPMGVLGGVKILAAQSIGAGRPEKVRIILGAGLALAVVMAACSETVAFFAAGLLHHVSATVATGDAAMIYLRIGAIGAVPILVRVAVEQARLAIGDSRSPMRVNLFANACNVALNYWFIFVLEMGVAGAAIATLIANIISCTAMLWVQAGDGFVLRGYAREQIASVWRLGFPSGLQMALEMGAFATMVVMLTNLSELDGAANQIAIQVLHFGFLPCLAIGQAASVLAGQAVGAGRREWVRGIAMQAMLPACAYALLAGMTFLLAGEWIAGHFTDDPALLQLTTRLFYVAAVFQLADAVDIVSRSVLQGTGDVRFCAWTGITLAWMLTPPLTWLLAYHYELGALGGWLGLCVELFIATVVFSSRVRGTRWHAAADRSIAGL
jgi:MATE family multidrug resistance protein